MKAKEVVRKSSSAKVSARQEKPKRRNAAVAAMQQSVYREYGYEEALIKNIVDGSKKDLVPESAITFASSIAALTPSMKRISYNHGQSVGRELYSLLFARRGYRWYMESVADLVTFFEMAGYRNVMYKILTDRIEIIIHKEDHYNMGCTLHSFEAGIIGGFMSAASGNRTIATELSCCNNNGRYCNFSTFLFGEDKSAGIKDIVKFASVQMGDMTRSICPEYQLLAMQPLMDKTYSGEVSLLLEQLGRLVSESIKSADPKIKEREKLERASHICASFGLGDMAYTLKPAKVEVAFNGVRAKKEFVDISVRFLCGILDATTKKSWTAEVNYSKQSGSYKAVMKED